MADVDKLFIIGPTSLCSMAELVASSYDKQQMVLTWGWSGMRERSWALAWVFALWVFPVS